MVTWQEITAHLKGQFGAEEMAPTLLRVHAPVGQAKVAVYVGYETLPDGFGEWVQLLADVGDFNSLSFGKVLQTAASYVVGAVALTGGRVVLKHSAAMRSLDLTDINPALWLLSSSAAQLTATCGKEA